MKNLLKINIGIIFVSLLVLICIMSSMLFITASFVKSGKTTRGDAIAREQAYYASLSGIEYAYYKMNTDVFPKEKEIKFDDVSVKVEYDIQGGNIRSTGNYSSTDDKAEHVLFIKGPKTKDISDCILIDQKSFDISNDGLNVFGAKITNKCDADVLLNEVNLQCKSGKISGKIKKISFDDKVVFYDESARTCGSKIVIHDVKIASCGESILTSIEFEKPVDKESIKISFDFE